MWKVFREMDKVPPLSCIIWILVIRQKSFSRFGLKWNEKKRVMKLKENKRQKKMSFGLMCSGRSIQSKVKNMFKMFKCSFKMCLKSVTTQWNSSLAELSVHIPFHLVAIKHVTVWTRTIWDKKRQLIQVTMPFNVPIMCDNCNFLNDVGVARCLGVALVRFENQTPLHHRLIGQLCAAKTDRPGSFMALYNSNLMVDVITQYEPLPHWLPAAFSFLHSLIGRWLHEKNKTKHNQPAHKTMFVVWKTYSPTPLYTNILMAQQWQNLDEGEIFAVIQ